MSYYNFDLRALIWLGAFIVLVVWGCWELFDWFFIEENITTTKPIIPEINLIIKDNKVDTLYIYKQP